MGMVTNVTTFSRSGLSDWLLQRVTAIILAAYSVFMVLYLLLNPGLDSPQWLALHGYFPMKLFTLATVVSVAIHAWIGLWSVLTDYITVRLMGPKAVPLRIVLEVGMILLILAAVVWAFDILWGI